MSALSRASTSRFWTRAGSSFVASWSTKRRGTADSLSPSCCQHEPYVPLMQAYFSRQPQDASPVHVHSLRTRSQRRSHRRVQCFRARTALVSPWRNGAVGPLEEAGTRRSDSGHRGLSAVGIPVVHGGEDVNLHICGAIAYNRSSPPTELNRARVNAGFSRGNPARCGSPICRFFATIPGYRRKTDGGDI